MMEIEDIKRICNRHKARLLCNLEDAECPVVWRKTVSDALNWLRSDLMNEAEEDGAGNR